MKRKNKKTIMFNAMLEMVQQYKWRITEKEIQTVVNILFDRPIAIIIEDYGSLQKLKKAMKKEGYKIEVIK